MQPEQLDKTWNQDKVSEITSPTDHLKETIQQEIDRVFMKYEELRAAFFFYGSAITIPTWFIWSIAFGSDPEKAMALFGSMYLPFFCAIVLHRPAWKIRKFLYLYRHHRHESRKWIVDPLEERE
jgi:hypothetical protein